MCVCILCGVCACMYDMFCSVHMFVGGVCVYAYVYGVYMCGIFTCVMVYMYVIYAHVCMVYVCVVWVHVDKLYVYLVCEHVCICVCCVCMCIGWYTHPCLCRTQERGQLFLFVILFLLSWDKVSPGAKLTSSRLQSSLVFTRHRVYTQA